MTQSRRLILAVDFDGTIVKDAYPDIGKPVTGALLTLKRLKAEGVALVLYTCRQGERLEEAVAWCRERGLVFDAVNADVPETLEAWAGKYGGGNYKPFADRYLDDRHVGNLVGPAAWRKALHEMMAVKEALNRPCR
jgi:hypothetical protein